MASLLRADRPMTTPILEQLRSACPDLFTSRLFVLERHASSLGFGDSYAEFRTPDFGVRFQIERDIRSVYIARANDMNTWWEWGWLLQVPPPPPHVWSRKHTDWSSVQTDVLAILDNFELISLLMGEAFEVVTRPVFDRFSERNSWGTR